MPYLGSTPNASFSSRTKQDFTANGSTTAFTLSSAVASANDIEVFVGNVRQEPTDAYTVNGTALTMSAAPANGLNFYVVFKGLEENSVVPADGSISDAKIASSAVTSAKIGSGAVTDAKIDTVTASKLLGTIAGARLPAGSVLQVVSTEDTSNVQITGATYQDLGINLSITPTSSSSKILIFMSGMCSASEVGNFLWGRFYRDTTTIGHSNGFGMSSYDDSPNNRRFDVWSRNYLDSPNTTSAVTYSIRAAVYDGGSYEVGGWWQDAGWNGGTSITLMEIAG